MFVRIVSLHALPKHMVDMGTKKRTSIFCLGEQKIMQQRNKNWDNLHRNAQDEAMLKRKCDVSLSPSRKKASTTPAAPEAAANICHLCFKGGLLSFERF